MAYVSSFIYCESIQQMMTPQGVQSQIVNPLQALVPVSLPSNYSFAVACSVMDYVQNKDNHLELVFLCPSGKEAKMADITIGPTNVVIPGKKQLPAIQFNLEVRNFILREEGVHQTRIILNGEELARYPIAVVIGEDNEQPGGKQ